MEEGGKEDDGVDWLAPVFLTAKRKDAKEYKITLLKVVDISPKTILKERNIEIY